MTTEQLDEILRNGKTPRGGSVRTIAQELVLRGYKDVRRGRYADFPIPAILRGRTQNTEWHAAGRREYKGSIYTDVERAEGAEFIAISVNTIDKKADISLPYKILLFVKEP